MQPAQQQGRRIPSISSVRVLSIRWLLVSGFLADSIQQIHSLRARGVISSHTARAALAEVRVFCKSAGILCTTPPATCLPVGKVSFLVIPSMLCKLVYLLFVVHKRIILNLQASLIGFEHFSSKTPQDFPNTF